LFKIEVQKSKDEVCLVFTSGICTLPKLPQSF